MKHSSVCLAASIGALLLACGRGAPPDAPAHDTAQTPPATAPPTAPVDSASTSSSASPQSELASPVSGPAQEDLPPAPPRVVELAPLDLTTITDVPRLVVDGHGHTAKVRSLLYTADGRYLVSAGYDKVVRVWSGASGELVRTLRGDIGAGPAGRIYTLALSSGDRLLAVGGWLGRDDAPDRLSSEDAYKVSVLDFHSGTTIQRLSGHSDVVLASAFAHRGERLLTGAGDHTAIIWDATKWSRLATLSGHAGGVTAVAWSPDDRLVVTGSVDRSARVFSADSGALEFVLTGHTDVVSAVAFTPSGRSVLTASADGTVRIHDAKNGTLLKVLAELRVPIASLGISPDGLHVLVTTSGGDFASHVIHINTSRLVASNRSHDNVVLASAISPNGKWVATAGGDDFGLSVWDLVTGGDQVRTRSHGSAVWNVAFRKDGGSIAWGHELSAEAHAQKQLNGPVRHELPLSSSGVALAIAHTGADQNAFVRAIERVHETEIRTPTGGDHEDLLVHQGGARTVTLRRDVTTGFVHRAYSLTPDGRVVISGGDNGALTSFRADTGEKLREFVGHGGDVLALAISPDGRRLVSGSNDQTVRLWDVASGQLLLSVFHARNGEWVAFTPSGYYASSAYGDAYVGWHTGRGPEQPAAYFPASALANQLRHELVVRHYLLADGSITAAIRSCNEALPPGQPPFTYYRFQDLPQFAPPRVYYLDPGTDVRIQSDRIEVTAKAHSPTLEPITDLRFRVNGRPVDAKWMRAVGAPYLWKNGREATLRATLPLPEKVNRITVVASNRHSDSEPIGFDVHRAGGQGELEKIYQPSLYLLSVGVSRYGSPWLKPLSYAHADAQAVAEALEKQNRNLYRRVHARTLTDRAVSRGSLLEQLNYLTSGAEQQDVVVLFLSGYAAVDDQGEYYFLPHDADPARMSETALSWRELSSALAALPSKVVLLLDSSHGGAVTNRQEVWPIDVSQLLRKNLSPESGLIVLTSSTGAESSFESSKWKHGAFTTALLEGLRGQADYDRDRRISLREIEHFVSKRVPALTSGKQHPTSDIPSNVPNFILSDR